MVSDHTGCVSSGELKPRNQQSRRNEKSNLPMAQTHPIPLGSRRNSTVCWLLVHIIYYILALCRDSPARACHRLHRASWFTPDIWGHCGIRQMIRAKVQSELAREWPRLESLFQPRVHMFSLLKPWMVAKNLCSSHNDSLSHFTSSVDKGREHSLIPFAPSYAIPTSPGAREPAWLYTGGRRWSQAAGF